MSTVQHGEAKRNWAPWTTAEERVLREHYFTGGLEECMPKLPNRSLLSIYARAARLGLKTKVRNWEFKHWQKSEHIDEAIRRVYQNSPKSGDITLLASQLMRPRWWITKRARTLGLVTPRFRTLPWSDAELDLLAAHAHKSLATHPATVR